MANEKLVTLTGKCTNVKVGKRGEYIVAEFILQTEDDHVQYYKISGLTKEGNSDKFGVLDYENTNVEIKAYLNGRKSNGPKGTYFSNDLALKSIMYQQVK